MVLPPTAPADSPGLPAQLTNARSRSESTSGPIKDLYCTEDTNIQIPMNVVDTNLVGLPNHVLHPRVSVWRHHCGSFLTGTVT